MDLSGVTQATEGSVTAPSPKLVSAAHEFEAMMMKELLKPMTDSGELGSDDDDSMSGSGGIMGEFASEALGRALSCQGGFGIADQIVQELSHSSNGSGSGKVTSDKHLNTVIKTSK
jgi:Rod binding domain-containing protein